MKYLGCYGKVPAKGDFIHLGIDMAEKEEWDDWLQHGIPEGRRLLGSAWHDGYRQGVFWRFVMSVPTGWRTGLLGFSQDAVGREFPFLLLFGNEALPESVSAPPVDWDRSLQMAEQIARDVQSGALAVEQLTPLLRAVPWSVPCGSWRSQVQETLYRYECDGLAHRQVLESVLLEGLCQAHEQGSFISLWWHVPGSGHPLTWLLNRGPLTSDLFLELLHTGVPPRDGQRLQGGESTDQEELEDPQRPAASEEIIAPTDQDQVDFDSLLK